MNEKEYYKNNYNHVKLQLDENKEKMKKVKEELSKYINLFNEKNNFNINNEKKSNVIFNYSKLDSKTKEMNNPEKEKLESKLIEAESTIVKLNELIK